MNKNTLYFKSLLITTALRLQFKPFIWLFELYYKLAVKSAIFCLKRVSGVCAVYLTGSSTRKEIIYGLSDLDFKIFIRGKRNKLVDNKIKSIFKTLRYIFPIWGPPDEKGIYFLGNFEEDFKNYPLIQYVFDNNFYMHKLLWGEDIILELNLSEVTSNSQKMSYLWKFKDSFERIISFYSSNSITNIQKKYLFYKMVSDIGLIYMNIKNRTYCFKNRNNVLDDIKQFMPDKECVLIDLLIKERNQLFKNSFIDFEESFGLFKRLVVYCMDEIEEQKSISLEDLSKQETLSMTPEIICHINSIKSIYGSEDVEVKVLPSTYIPVSPLDCKSFNYLTYIIISKRVVSLSVVIKLREFYQSELIDKAVLLIKENDSYLYSLYSEFTENWLHLKTSEQITFNMLEPRESNLFSLFYIDLLKDKLSYNILQIENILEATDIYKISPEIYIRFLFLSLRNLILYRSILSGEFMFLLNTEQIIDFLKQNTPLNVSFIDALYSEYVKIIDSKDHYIENLFEKSMIFLKTFVEIVKNNLGFEKLEILNKIEDRKKLNISMIIVTRSRAGQLKRCLSALLELTRKPDEIIIVDNASIDSTKDVVSDFSKLLPINYVYEPKEGISIAKNSGLKIAQGDIIAFTDDDAIVDKEWLYFIEKSFLKDPEIGIIGGSIYNMKSERSDLLSNYFDKLDMIERG